MNPNQFNPNPFGPAYAGTIPVMPKAKQTQPLTPEIIAKLKEKDNGIKIEVSQEDLWRASCTHKENGEASLIFEGHTDDGRQIVRCNICGERFAVTEATDEQVDYAVNLIMDLLQTVKLFYVDAPENLIVQYFQMIPLLKQFATLYKKALSNFSKYEQAANNESYAGVSGINGFQMIGSMINPYMYGAPPIQGYGYGVQPPVQYPVYGGPVAPAPTPVPVAPGVQPTYNPYAGSPLMNPAAPPQNTEVAPAPPPITAQAPQTGAVPEVSQTKQFNV